MKIVSAVLFWNVMVTCSALKRDPSFLLEGKVTGLTYDEELAKDLQYLAPLKDLHDQTHGVTTVVHEYYTITARRCLKSKYITRNEYQDTYVLILNKKCYVERVFEESIYNDLVNPYETSILEFDLAVIKLRSPATVPAIRLYPQRPLCFGENTEFKIVLNTDDGPVALPLKLDSIISEDFQPVHLRTYTAEIDGCYASQFSISDFGCPVVVDNFLVGICTLQKIRDWPQAADGHYLSEDDVIKAITFTTIYDHSPFARLILNFYDKSLADVKNLDFIRLLREDEEPVEQPGRLRKILKRFLGDGPSRSRD